MPEKDRLEEIKQDVYKLRALPEIALSSFTVGQVRWLVAEVERLRQVDKKSSRSRSWSATWRLYEGRHTRREKVMDENKNNMQEPEMTDEEIDEPVERSKLENAALAEQPAIEQATAITRVNPDLENITVSATSPGAIPHMQEGILHWVRAKLIVVQRELDETEKALAHAVKNKWASGALRNAVSRLEQFENYYSKIQSALEAGYCLFPNTEATVFSVRVNTRRPKPHGTFERWRPVLALESGSLPKGVGRYVSVEPTLRSEQRADVTTEKHEVTTWWERDEFRDVAFPVIACKPELMEVSSQAMSRGIFDELGLVGVRDRKGDPVIVGRITGPGGRHRVTFLIGWWVDTRAL